MAFTNSEIAEHAATIEKLLWSKRRPPLHLRDKVVEGHRFEGHTIEFFLVRPSYQNPKQTVEHPFAKVKYIRKNNTWRLYWLRANGKWEGYEPSPTTKSLADALRLIDQDACHCFFG